MHFFTWVLALWLPIALQLNFKSLETIIDWLIVLTNCLNRLQNRKYTLTLDIIKEDEESDVSHKEPDSSHKETESDEFYRRLNKMNEQVKKTYSFNKEQDDTNPEDANLDLEQYNQEQYYKEMEEMQEQVNKLSQLEENSNTNILDDVMQSHDVLQSHDVMQSHDVLQSHDVMQSHDSTPEEYKDIENIVAKVNSVNNKVYIDESLE